MTLAGDLNLTGQDTLDQYAIIGHGDEPGDSDAGNTVSGDVTIRVGGDATLTNAFVSHQIDPDGTYASGNTYIGVEGAFTTDAASQLNSARNNPMTGDGELRIYLSDASNDLVDPNTLLNGVAHGNAATPNDQGDFDFGLGPYDPGNSATGGAEVAGNFNYYVSSLAGFYNYIINGAEAAAIVAALAGGDVDIDRNLNQAAFGAILDTDGGTQFITVNNDIFYGSIFDLAFLTTGDINFNASVQNLDGSADAGDINIVAGWDGSTAYDTATFSAVDVNAANPTLFGNQGFVSDMMVTPSTGSVFIGDGMQTAGIAVGSRRGTANVFAHDVALQAGNGAGDNRFAQLGFQVSDGIALDGTDLDPANAGGANVPVDGAITVHARDDLAANGGSGVGSYAQVGHVGADVLSGGPEEGIEADAEAVIEISAGNNINFFGGAGVDSYAQIGQGGRNADGDHAGTTTITTANDIRFTGGGGLQAYAQLGQGGQNADGNHSGTTTITTANDIVFIGGPDFSAYAQLGQGGQGAGGNHGGTTTITAANDIIFTGGSGSSAFAQLGQGGNFAQGNHSGTTTITSANDITFTGGGDFFAYAQLGQGGAGAIGNHSGTTTITSANDITFTGGSDSFTYAQLGHGGIAAEGNHSGAIDITHTGNLILAGLDVIDQFAIIGHGDEFGDADGGNTVDGMITVQVGGDIDVSNGFIGHLLDADGVANTGGVLITSGGDVSLTNQINLGVYDSEDSYTILARGDVNFNSGLQNRSETGGDIRVVAGWNGVTLFDQNLFSGQNVNTTTLFGRNGGSIVFNEQTQGHGIAVGSRSGATALYGHDVLLDGGQALSTGLTTGRYAQIGFQVTNGTSMDGTVLGGGPVVDGDIIVRATGQIEAITSGGVSDYVQIGHIGGDYSAANSVVDGIAGGDISVAAAEVISFAVAPWALNDGMYAQLGHGGRESRGGSSGNIEILGASGILFTGGQGDDGYVQLGNGGRDADGNHSGNISIQNVGDILFTGGSGERQYAQLGNGGLSASGDHSGNISLTRFGSLRFTAGTGRDSHAQLGMGGAVSIGDLDGHIELRGGGDIEFQGSGFDSFALLGHGGRSMRGSVTGNISLLRTGDFTFSGGPTNQAPSQLGHGGYQGTGDVTGDISIRSVGSVNLQGALPGGNGSLSNAQIGHGGYFWEGDVTGDISISDSGPVSLTGGAASVNAYTQIGHGGFSSEGNYTGDILINVRGDVNLVSSFAQSYAQIGHGGFAAEGDNSGDIGVTLSGNLRLSGNADVEVYSVIGHGDEPGDTDAGNSVSGNVMVRSGGSAVVFDSFVGHIIDSDGTYADGDTFIGVGQNDFTSGGTGTLTADAGSEFNSAPGGQLRFYIPNRNGYQIAAGTLLNGTAAEAPGTVPLPNEQGFFTFGNGPYNLTDPGNFAFYFGLEAEVEPAPVDPPIIVPQPFGFAGFVFPLDIKFIRIGEDLRENDEERDEQGKRASNAEVPVVPAEGQEGTFKSTIDEEGNTIFSPGGPPQSPAIQLR